jgi:hypothetical protein
LRDWAIIRLSKTNQTEETDMKTAIYSTVFDNESAAVQFAAAKRAEGYSTFEMVPEHDGQKYVVEYWDFFDAPVADVPYGC